jgi:uncharacterized protein
MPRTLPLLCLSVIAALLSGCATMYADALMYPERQPLPKGPADYGLEFEDVTFTSLDDVELKGWLIPGEGEKVVIIAHPGGFTRYGISTKDQRGLVKFAKEDVEFLNTSRQLHDAGYTVFMFDFRNHGESGQSPNGGVTGVGLEEYRDVIAAVRYVRSRAELADQPIGFVSFCQGANATIIAMSKGKEELEQQGIRCMLAVQPISVKVFSYSVASDLNFPGGLLPRAEEIVLERGGHALEDMSPLPYAKDVFVPALVVQAKSDPWTELEHVQAIYDAMPGPKELLWLDGEMVRFDTYNYFGHTPEPMLQFLGEHMGEVEGEHEVEVDHDHEGEHEVEVDHEDEGEHEVEGGEAQE